MSGLPVTRRRQTVFSTLCRVAAAAAVLGVAASCSTGTVGGSGGTAPSATATAVPTGPVTAEISQFRDNYSKQIIEIQLTNTTGAALTRPRRGTDQPAVRGADHVAGAHGPDSASARTDEEPPGAAARTGMRQPVTGPKWGGNRIRHRRGQRVCLPPAGGAAGHRPTRNRPTRNWATPNRRHRPGRRPVRRLGAEQFRDVPGPGSLGRGRDHAGSGP